MRINLFISILLVVCLNAPAQLKINEILSSNLTGIRDEDFDYPDWIEIFNAGTSSVNLNGYSLSDDYAAQNKWTFPSVTLAPSGLLVVYASGKDRKNTTTTYYQTLIDAGDEWKYLVPVSPVASSWNTKGFDDSGWLSGPSGFGYADNDDATVIGPTMSVYVRKHFTITDLSSIVKLVLHVDYDDGFVAYINGIEVARELLGSPGDIIAYDQGTTVDHEAQIFQGGSPNYFEVVNPQGILTSGDNIIAIQCHNVSTTSTDFTLIPFLTIGRNGAGSNNVSSYLEFPSSGGLHTNFKIDKDGEGVYLFDPSGQLVDSASPGLLLNDISYGRKPDGTSQWLYFQNSTPGIANVTAGLSGGIAGDVIFSKIGGKHIGGLTLSLAKSDPMDNIFYTTDGSIPTNASTPYSGPININNNMVVRARAYNSAKLPGRVISNTYATQLNHDIPIISISTNPENLWDELSGIYMLGPGASPDPPNYGANFWQDWERPVHIEYYDVHGVKQIDQDAGVKIFGGWSRSNDQKSLALFARREYGKGSFTHNFFHGKNLEKFESLVLRNSGNDNRRLMFHDCFMTGLARDMDIEIQAFQPTAVYLNGEYWGLLNLREKVNENYLAGNFNIDAENINLLEQHNNVIEGTNSDYNEIINFLYNNSSLSGSDKYEWLNNQVDVDQFIRYQLTEIYLNNKDWPGNNVKFWNTRNPDSRWRWILFDTDFGYGLYDQGYSFNTIEFALEPYGPEWPNPPWSTLMLRRLVTNTEMRNSFINQFCDRLNVDFHPDRVNADLDSLTDLYDGEIVNQANRWGGLSYNEWIVTIDGLRYFADVRPGYCREFLRQKFSLGAETTITLDVSDKYTGDIMVNTVVPHSYPFHGVYFRNLPITLKAIPKPGYKFVRWEGDNATSDPSISYDMHAGASFQAVFEEAGASDISIVINEINYASSDTWDTKDWVELFNNGSASVDLAGWLFSDAGPDTGYYIPDGVILPPREFLVICRDNEDFFDFNPMAFNTIGDFPFGLSADGDDLRLYDKEGNIMDAVDFRPYFPWPQNIAASGLTIELKDPGLDNMEGENWQASELHGTPGGPNSGVLDIEEYHQGKPAFSMEAFPNPFRDFTTILFQVEKEGRFRLEIYDINGRCVKVLVDENLIPDTYYIDWHGTGEGQLPGGIYTLRLSGNNMIQTMKIVKLD